MSDRLLVSWLPGETRAARLRDGQLIDLLVLRDDRPAVCGNIYLGRVSAAHGGMDSVFVELGEGMTGLLPRRDNDGNALAEGARVLVQAIREPFGGKGARLKLVTGADAKSIEDDADGRREPGMVRRADDRLFAFIRAADVGEILADQAEMVRRLRTTICAMSPESAVLVRWAPESVRLFEHEGIEQEIDALLEPHVALPSGGALTIEPVSSMTPIDVDSGSGAGASLALATNREAATEIPRQLRLRGLAGLIVVDFLALESRAQQGEIQSLLKRGLKADPVPSRVFAMRPSGLLELTRRRSAPSLNDVLTEACGLGGAGRRKSAASLGYEALRAVLRVAGEEQGRPPRLRVRPRVADVLERPLAPALRFVEARLGQRVEVIRVEADDVTDFEVG